MTGLGAPARAILALLLVLATACASEDASASTEEALEALEAELLTRETVTWASADLDRSTGTDQPAAITVMARSSLTGESEITDLADAVLQTTWESDVPRISRITVRVSSEEADARHEEIAVPRDELEQRFGPRE